MSVPAQAVGIDVGGTNLRAARIDAAGRLDGLVRVRIDAPSADAVIERIVALAAPLVDDAVVAVGVGIPGRLSLGGEVVLSAGFLELAGVRLAGRLEARLARPVVVDNDSRLALVAELAIGAARGAGTVALFTIGTGIGGAVAFGGRLVHGRGNAGQLGHLALPGDGMACRCGRLGCVETRVSGTALAAAIAEAGFPPGTTAERLLELEADGDLRAAGVLDGWAAAIRAAADGATAAYDPDLVVLGGGLGPLAARVVDRTEPGSPWYVAPVVAAALGDDAGVIGAGLLALERAGAGAAHR